MKAKNVTAYAGQALLRRLGRSNNRALRAEVARFIMENRFHMDVAPELPIEVTCEKSVLRELLARVGMSGNGRATRSLTGPSVPRIHSSDPTFASMRRSSGIQDSPRSGG